MKRLSLLKNLALFSGATLAIAPAVFTSTGCSCAVTTFYVDALSYENYTSVTSESNVSREKVKFDRLLSGDKKLHNGNYIFIIGSTIESGLDNFYGNGMSRKEYYDANESLPNSVLFKTFIKMPTLPDAANGINNFGIYSFVDYFDQKFTDKKGHEILIADENKPELAITKIKPFDTWGNRIKATKVLNKNGTKDFASYDWDDTSVSSTDFIRNDDNAVAYRAFVKRAIALYPKTAKRTNTFSDTKNAENCKIAIFKNGVLDSIDALPQTGEEAIKTFAEKLVKIYKK